MGRKKRHHFIPRMLLKRFASRSEDDGSKSYVYMYTVDRPPIEFSTKDAAVSKNFHGRDEDLIENKFAEMESKHDKILRNIEEDKSEISNFGDDISDFMWLIGLRTRATRSRLSNTFLQMIAEMEKQTSSNEAQDYYQRAIDTAVETAIADHLKHMNVFERIAYKKTDEYKFVLNEANRIAKAQASPLQIAAIMRQGLNFLGSEFASRDVAKDGHNRGLSKLLESGARCPAKRKPSRWLAVESKGTEYVLGDSCAFAVSGDNKFGPLVATRDDWKEIYLPISSSLALVGMFHDGKSTLDCEKIVKLSIETSFESVFSSKNCSYLISECAENIGKNAVLFDENEKEEIVKSVWRE